MVLRPFAIVFIGLTLLLSPRSSQSLQDEARKPAPEQLPKATAAPGRHSIIAYVSRSKGTVRVLRKYRNDAAKALHAEALTHSHWLLRQGDKRERLKLELLDGQTLNDDDDPKIGDTRVARNCKCTGNVVMQDSGCQSADVGSYRIVRLGYSTCETNSKSSCPETYTDVIYKYSYIDQNCQKETAKRALQQEWVCLP